MGATPFRFSRLFWALAPAATVLLCAFFSLLPFGLVGGLVVTPAFALIPLYYWTVNRPELLPPVVVFGLGIAQDIATAGPVGLWGIVFLMTYAVTLAQRSQLAGLPLRLAWMAFAGVALAGLLAGWFTASVYYSVFVPVLPMVVQALLTAAVFPALVWVLVFVEGEIAVAMR